ncbi:hypothetical protein EVAR_91388_1 [Eumeta japonica]|uniref:Uncharacterized protein n=1 Tax=Eumeta variegata TaxID=151549 RepID=A0A4C1XAY2_EUMVA|nr:hypothetical protein EVAR_91388_1 [Eumeta japonica]
MVPWNQIFAQALGFRMNFDEPPNSFHPYHHIHRRTVYDRVQMLLDKNDLNGFDCIRRAICEVEAMQVPRGIYYKILKIIFRQNLGSEIDRNLISGGMRVGGGAARRRSVQPPSRPARSPSSTSLCTLISDHRAALRRRDVIDLD